MALLGLGWCKGQPNLCMVKDQDQGIIAVKNDDYLVWGPVQAHHRYCVRHLTSSFHAKFHKKSLKMLLVRFAYERQPYKFEYQIWNWLLWSVRRCIGGYCRFHLRNGLYVMTGGGEGGGTWDDDQELLWGFNSVLKGAHNIPMTDCV